jgi:hypothetical protein
MFKCSNQKETIETSIGDAQNSKFSGCGVLAMKGNEWRIELV